MSKKLYSAFARIGSKAARKSMRGSTVLLLRLLLLLLLRIILSYYFYLYTIVSKKELYAAFARIGLKGSAKERARLHGTIITITIIIAIIIIIVLIYSYLSFHRV